MKTKDTANSASTTASAGKGTVTEDAFIGRENEGRGVFGINGDREFDEAERAVRGMGGQRSNEAMRARLTEHVEKQRASKKVVAWIAAIVAVLALTRHGTSVLTAFHAKEAKSDPAGALVEGRASRRTSFLDTNGGGAEARPASRSLEAEMEAVVALDSYELVDSDDAEKIMQKCNAGNVAVTILRTYNDGEPSTRKICPSEVLFYNGGKSMGLANGVRIIKRPGRTDFQITGDMLTQGIDGTCDVDLDCDTGLSCPGKGASVCTPSGESSALLHGQTCENNGDCLSGLCKRGPNGNKRCYCSPTNNAGCPDARPYCVGTANNNSTCLACLPGELNEGCDPAGDASICADDCGLGGAIGCRSQKALDRICQEYSYASCGSCTGAGCQDGLHPFECVD